MVKKTDRRKPRSILALISVLTIVVAFVGVCYLTLYILHNAGVFQLPSFLEPAQTAEVTQSVEYDLDQSVKNTYRYMPTNVSDMDFKKFLEHSPYTDSYFMKATLYSYSKDSYGFADYEYWIWKNGGKYKISVRDPSTSTLIKVIICDGERVQIQDEMNSSVEYYNASEYTLISQTPIPDFKELFEEGYELAYFGENEEELFITLNALSQGSVINYLFNKNRGFISGYEVFKDDVMVTDFVLDTFEKISYTTDNMFKID